MTRDDVRTLANEVLTPILGPVGFAYSDVVEREDSVGEDALYVTVHMASDAEYLPGFRYSDALMAMQDALVDRGERRFAYLSRAEALLLLRDAHEAIELLEASDEDARRHLAVELLVAKSR